MLYQTWLVDLWQEVVDTVKLVSTFEMSYDSPASMPRAGISAELPDVVSTLACRDNLYMLYPTGMLTGVYRIKQAC